MGRLRNGFGPMVEEELGSLVLVVASGTTGPGCT